MRHPNAELDEDIAHVPARNACDPLDAEIDRLEALIGALGDEGGES